VTALVTGSAGGIGRAIVEKLTAEGLTVKELDLVNGFDVTDPDAWEHVGSVDLACLNAGVLTGDAGDISSLTDAQYRRAVGVNVDGVVFGVRRLARVMPKGSTIVATASLAGLTAIADDPVYGMTKHAVVGFVRSVAPQLAKREIRIQAVCPAWADTGLMDDEFKRELGEQGYKLLRPEHVAEGVWAAYRSEGTGEAWIVQPGAAQLRVQGRSRPPLTAQWQAVEPRSRNEPTAARKRHAYASRPSVSSRTPRVVALRASLFGRLVENRRTPFPPVPTTNSRMPRTRASPPRAVCGANRS